MKKRGIIITLLFFMIALIGCSASGGRDEKPVSNSSNQLTMEEKLDDFEYMHKILKENYPFFEVSKRLVGIDWLAKKEEYISKVKTTDSDESFFNVMQEILADLQNGHVHMVDSRSYPHLKDLYSKQPNYDKAWNEQLNNPKAVIRYSEKAKVAEQTQSRKDNIIQHNVKTDILEKGKTAYLSIHSFNAFNVEGDMKIIKPFLNEIKDYKVLIIDIRGNGGGTEMYWSKNIVPMLAKYVLTEQQYIAFRGGDFIEQFLKCRTGAGYEHLELIESIKEEGLENMPPELCKDFKYYYKRRTSSGGIPQIYTGFEGKIYLLVDRYVFSASEGFASFAKSTGFATLVGEKTGGDGMGYDPVLCTLPNSGYIFRFSMDMGLSSDGTCNFECKTVPDIIVEAKVGQTYSEDEAIQTVLKLTK